MHSPIDRLWRYVVFGPLLVVAILICLFTAFRWQSDDRDLFRPKDLLDKLQLVVQSLRKAPGETTAVAEKIKSITGGDRDKEKMLLAELALLDRELAKLKADGTLAERYVLDIDVLSRKIAQAKELSGTPFSIAYTAIRRLRDENTLRSLKWREFSRDGDSSAREEIVAEIPRTLFDQRNPWGGIAGRIFLEQKSEIGKQTEYLFVSGQLPLREGEKIAVVGLQERYPSTSIQGINVISGALARYLRYDDSYNQSKGVEGQSQVPRMFSRSLVDKNNRILISGKQVPVGYDVIMTINPKVQQLLQSLVNRTLEHDSIEDVRFMAMDIDTGEIIAATEASNVVQKQDSLPLVFQVIPPASTTKIIFAAALLENGKELSTGSPAAAQMLAELPLKVKTSETKYFQEMALDHAAAPAYRRQAEKFGWNGDCSSDGDCAGAVIDYLFGSRIYTSGGTAPFEYPLLGRILIEPAGTGKFKPMPGSNLKGLPSLGAIEKPGHPAPGVSREKYDLAKMVKTQVAGQGDCRTSLWGELLLIAHVARAARGKSDVPLPHLVREVRNAGGATVAITPAPKYVPVAMSRENAERLAGYLAQINFKGGSADSTFMSVFGRYAGADDRIIAKTGTTDFENLATPFRLYVAAYARKPGNRIDTAVISVIKNIKNPQNPEKAEKFNRAAELALRFIRETQQRRM